MALDANNYPTDESLAAIRDYDLMVRPLRGKSKMADAFYQLDDLETCQRCLGEGFEVICWDDLCANSDSCMHGDGEGVCPECEGAGFLAITGHDGPSQ